MKKRIGTLIAALLFLSLSIEGVVAASPIEVVTEVSQKTIDAAVSIFGPPLAALIGTYGESSDIFFAKILLLLLLFMIIYVVLRKVPAFERQKGVVVLISLIVSIFAVRFISESQLVQGILLPYGVLGVALATILPFLIFFYFLHVSRVVGFMRRLAWAVYGIIFLVLWISRWDQIGEEANYIYVFTLIAIALAFIFDKSVQRYFGTHELAVWKRGANQKVIAALQSEYLNILHVNSRAAEGRRRAIEYQLRTLGGDLP